MTDREKLIEKINAVIFTPVRTRSSYDMTHVDDFLDALVVALRQGRAVEPLVDMVRFSTVRFREGYEAREVDRFLDQVVAESKRLTGGPEGSRPGAPEPSEVGADDSVAVTAGPEDAQESVERSVPQSYAEAPGVIEERQGLLGRLFKR
ncbi:hypothetical protein ASG90_08195 [Nocardioides sp. Soil797]|nr:hypothetical protein ASG90_08195 [Nocardioides sp. Soil797]